jgi:glycosyltransferase involved in cell wall biosynthesis
VNEPTRDDETPVSARSGPARRILLVAYFYPPMTIIGARRPHALAKWLRRRGHDVVVLTSQYGGRSGGDPSIPVLRSRDLLATRLNWRRQNFEVITGQRAGSWQPGPGIWGSIFVPDVQLLSWVPFAAGAALRQHARRPFDAVITTSPVESTHGVGIALSRQGVPWIADLRDGWCFENPRDPLPLRIQRRLDAFQERTVVRGADQVVTVSEPLTSDLRRRYGVSAITITNGFDPDHSGGASPPAGAVSTGKLTLVHTGGLGGERTLAPLLEGLARLGRIDPTLVGRIELVLAGAQTEPERALYAQPQFAPFVRHLGFIDHEQAIGLQRAADVLVLVTSGVRTGEATGKLYEYLAAARPILVLGAGSAAADIVVAARAGTAIPVRDPDAAEQTLRGLLATPPRRPPDSAREPYAYPRLAAGYEETIEQTIARRQARAADARV